MNVPWTPTNQWLDDIQWTTCPSWRTVAPSNLTNPLPGASRATWLTDELFCPLATHSLVWSVELWKCLLIKYKIKYIIHSMFHLQHWYPNSYFERRFHNTNMYCINQLEMWKMYKLTMIIKTIQYQPYSIRTMAGLLSSWPWGGFCVPSG